MENLQEPTILVLNKALRNPDYAKEFLAHPAEVFRRDAAVEILEADDKSFEVTLRKSLHQSF